MDKILNLPLCIKMQLVAHLTPNVNYLILLNPWDNHLGWVVLLFPLQSIVKEVVNNKHINVYEAFSLGPDILWGVNTCWSTFFYLSFLLVFFVVRFFNKTGQAQSFEQDKAKNPGQVPLLDQWQKQPNPRLKQSLLPECFLLIEYTKETCLWEIHVKCFVGNGKCTFFKKCRCKFHSLVFLEEQVDYLCILS